MECMEPFILTLIRVYLQTFATIKRIQLGKYYKTTDPKEREKIELNPWVVFHTAVNNAGPVLETMSIKRGGGTYQVPVPVRDKRKLFLGMKWLIEAGMDKEPTIPMYKKLAWEILDAANETVSYNYIAIVFIAPFQITKPQVQKYQDRKSVV